jgi:hypothetical protein
MIPPMQKENLTELGISPAAAVFEIPNQLVIMCGRSEAMIVPIPRKKLCIENPILRCSEGSISPTKVRKGSIEIFIDASIIQSIPATAQSAEKFGMKIIAVDAKIAPTGKNCRLHPSLFQVLSLMCPIIG